MNSTFTIERTTNHTDSGWTRSETYPDTYTSSEAQDIVESANANKANRSVKLQYRAVPVIKYKYIVEADTAYNINTGEHEFGAAAKRVMAGLIADEDVQKRLPFQTSLGAGNNYVHIVNESLYKVKTNHHTIEEGDTLCYRLGGVKWHLADLRDATVPTCPGCLAKAKWIIVNVLHERNPRL